MQKAKPKTVKLLAGRAMILPDGTIIYLPPGVRVATLVVWTVGDKPVRFGTPPEIGPK